MTHDDGLRIIQPEREEQIQQRLLLRFGARVGRSALAVESAFVADADRVAVVVLAVGARLLFRSSGMDMSVARDVVVVADVTEVPVLHVVAFAGLEAQALALRRGRAVNDNQSDGSHTFFCLTEHKDTKSQSFPLCAALCLFVSLCSIINIDFILQRYNIADARFHAASFEGSKASDKAQ